MQQLVSRPSQPVFLTGKLLSRWDLMKLFPMRLVERMAALHSELGKILERKQKLLAHDAMPTMADALLATVPETPTDIADLPAGSSVDMFMQIMRELCEDMKLKQTSKNLRDFSPAPTVSWRSSTTVLSTN